MKLRLGILILGLIVTAYTIPAFSQTENDDVRCGPGTVMRNEVCVLDESIVHEEDERMEEPMEEMPQVGIQQESSDLGQIMEGSIPDWVRSTAEWWADGLISDTEFISSIEYLMAQGIIQVETPEEHRLELEIVQLKQEKAKMEGDMQEITDQLERVDDYLDSKSIAVPVEIWAGNATEQPSPVQCGPGTVMRDGGCVLIDTKDVLRDLAGQWGSNQITQAEYLGELQVLVNNNKIEGLNCTNTTTQSNATMPEWIKDTARFYSNSSIRYDEFLVHLEHLCKAGFLHK